VARAKPHHHPSRTVSLDVSPKRIAWFRARLLAWYTQHRRDLPWRAETATSYERIISEVLLQQTPAKRVAALFPTFVAQFSSWDTLAGAMGNDLEQLLRPLGLWRRHATSLRALADAMNERRGVFPRKRDDIELLPAVGQYVASAVLLFCYEEPEPLLDGSMARLLERFFGRRTLTDIRHDPYLQALARLVVASDDPVSVNWATLDFAAKICRARAPSCELCTLRSRCLYASTSGLPTNTERIC
jgi:A/G-specific adenine glycosylase